MGKLLLDHFQIDDHLGGSRAASRWRHFRRAGQHGLDRLALGRTEVTLLRAAGIGYDNGRGGRVGGAGRVAARLAPCQQQQAGEGGA
jgi:hypothetical protein